ncbi:MAG: DciA family protein [Candidatus Lernaella stagnicola]|nr:DciA family protein [Candidatus Lernaella stagnicola]
MAAANKRNKAKRKRRVGKTIDSLGLLQRLSGELRLPDLDRSLVFSRWIDIVGRRYAEVSQPQRIAGSKLFVRVVDAMWAGDLRQHYDMILEKIEQVAGHCGIHKLHFVIGPIDAPLRPRPSKPPLSDVEVETADIDDALGRTKLAGQPELRQLMARVWANGRRLQKRREENEE